MLESIQSFEFAVLDFIQQNIRCDFLDALIPAVTHYGIVLWIAIAAIALFFNKTRKCGASMGAGMIMGLLVGNVILKNIVQRDRPCWINTSVELLVDHLSDYSFPSGHTLASFIAAIVIFRHNKKLGIPALILATFIAFTRLYLYVHFPTDILGAILLAVAVAIPVDILVTKAYNKVAQLIKEKRTTE